MSKHFRVFCNSGGSERIKAKDAAAAVAYCEEWLSAGEWGDIDSTIWVRGWVEDLSGEILDHVRVTIDPDEPDCSSDGGHDWRSDFAVVGGCKSNPGVWGSGGGIRYVEACHHCGCAKSTDTWAQDPETGEQGLTSVSYEEHEYTDRINEIADKFAKRIVEREIDDEDYLQMYLDGETDPRNYDLIQSDIDACEDDYHVDPDVVENMVRKLLREACDAADSKAEDVA